MPLNFEILSFLLYVCAGRADLCTLDSELSIIFFQFRIFARKRHPIKSNLQISSACCVIVRVGVVLKRNVVGD